VKTTTLGRTTLTIQHFVVQNLQIQPRITGSVLMFNMTSLHKAQLTDTKVVEHYDTLGQRIQKLTLHAVTIFITWLNTLK
jgi:hypothetical protein